MSWRVLDEWIRICAPRLENYLPEHSAFLQAQSPTRLNPKSRHKSRRRLRKTPGPLLQDQRSADSDRNEKAGSKPKANSPALSVKIHEFLHILVNAHPKSDIVGRPLTASCA